MDWRLFPALIWSFVVDWAQSSNLTSKPNALMFTNAWDTINSNRVLSQYLARKTTRLRLRLLVIIPNTFHPPFTRHNFTFHDHLLSDLTFSFCDSVQGRNEEKNWLTCGFFCFVFYCHRCQDARCPPGGVLERPGVFEVQNTRCEDKTVERVASSARRRRR